MMLKKFLPAAALLALAGAAHAQVTIYGLVDAAVQKVEGSQPTVVFGGNSTTRLGVKGSQDLGSGVKGNFQLEAGVDINGSSVDGTLFGRQAWGGFSGDFGELRAGRQDSVINQTMIGFDLNGASNTACAQCAAQIAGGTLGGSGQRSVQYISPALGGFKLHAGFQGKDTAVENSRSTVALAATYTLGVFTIAGATETKPTTDGQATHAYGASIDLGAAKVALNHSNTRGANGTMVGVVMPIAGMNVGVQFAVNADTPARGTELFVNKEILKNTLLYAEYLNGRTTVEDVLQRNRAFAVGVIYTF